MRSVVVVVRPITGRFASEGAAPNGRSPRLKKIRIPCDEQLSLSCSEAEVI